MIKARVILILILIRRLTVRVAALDIVGVDGECARMTERMDVLVELYKVAIREICLTWFPLWHKASKQAHVSHNANKNEN